ncbi:MAG: hypothetical protein KTR30_15440 [Saprospiraceae bacterium]|nr:hypothetical protein [Saprospiraceae bacterium]
MPISQGDLLFKLIKSLSKAEKRNFKLYVKRIQSEGEVMFFQLFEVLEKQKVYEEGKAKMKLNDLSKTQFSNLKRHLYQHLLTSLRLMHLNKQLDIQIRELIDYAYILYGKGLYIQSLKILSRAKALATNNHHNLLLQEIIEFEKRIESHHITRTTTERMNKLIHQAESQAKVNTSIIFLSNLKLELQRVFINKGHAKAEMDRVKILEDYGPRIRDYKIEQLSFFERVYYFQSLYWLHYILGHFERCHYYAGEWVGLYQEAPNMMEEDVDIYMRGLHQLLITCLYTSNTHTFKQTQAELEQFYLQHQGQFNTNSQILAFLYRYQAKFNRALMEGDYESGIQLIPEVKVQLDLYDNQLDLHKVHILYYKIAALYLCNGEAGTALDYLNLIINLKAGHLREDIQAYSRLLFLMAHYDLRNEDIMEYLTTSTGRFFKKIQDKNRLQEVSLRFFKQAMYKGERERLQLLSELRRKLEELSTDPFERRGFVYLDLFRWIDSKLKQQPIKSLELSD